MAIATAVSATNAAATASRTSRFLRRALSAIDRAKSSSSAVSAAGVALRATARTPGTPSPSRAGPIVRPFSSHRCAACFSWSRSSAPSSSCACHRTSRGHAFSSDSCTISTRWRLGSPSFPSTS